MPNLAASATGNFPRQLGDLAGLAAIGKRSKPIADIEPGHVSTASGLLGMASMRLGGRPLAYDPVKRIIPGDDEANKLLAREYRAPWKRPA